MANDDCPPDYCEHGVIGTPSRGVKYKIDTIERKGVRVFRARVWTEVGKLHDLVGYHDVYWELFAWVRGHAWEWMRDG